MAKQSWREKFERPCKICRELIRIKRRRFVRCSQDGAEHTMFIVGGHMQTKVFIEPLGSRAFANYTLQERLRLEAEKLYSARRQPIWIGAAIASRKSEGKSVVHLREIMSMNRHYIRALTSALDDMGWLAPVERIARRLEANANGN